MNTLKLDKRQEKGEETLNRILRQAIDIIASEGINGLSASKLSEGSGISKSTIFHHFKTTQDIPKLALQHIFEELMRPVEIEYPQTLEDYLSYLGSTIILISDAHQKIYRAFFSFYHESLFDLTYRQIMSDYLKATEDSIQEMIKKHANNTLSDAQTDKYVTLIISTLDGIGLHLLMGKEPDRCLQAWHLQTQLIVQSIPLNKETHDENH